MNRIAVLVVALACAGFAFGQQMPKVRVDYSCKVHHWIHAKNTLTETWMDYWVCDATGSMTDAGVAPAIDVDKTWEAWVGDDQVGVFQAEEQAKIGAEKEYQLRASRCNHPRPAPQEKGAKPTGVTISIANCAPGTNVLCEQEKKAPVAKPWKEITDVCADPVGDTWDVHPCHAKPIPFDVPAKEWDGPDMEPGTCEIYDEHNPNLCVAGTFGKPRHHVSCENVAPDWKKRALIETADGKHHCYNFSLLDPARP